MESYAGHLISVLIMLGGLVGVYTKIQTELTSIKTRLDIEKEAKDDRRRLRKAEVYSIVRSEIYQHRQDCPAVETTGVRTMPRNDSDF